ncbi:uncharacterized protein LOC124898421 [Capsicum annuum]|uniref:uncharacterized protein LOC124898421 n=1 Tax=Capsicum annuum TaxID=4072 RepID=UPI001FB17171|nr:uncharacterized protein LOC124898421 [Capsicum annuum]
MDARYILGKSKRRALDVTYSHHFRVERFCVVIDLQLQELNNYFNVVSTDLLFGMACLHPAKSFALVRGSDERFFNTKEITNLAKALVESELHQTWPLIYSLINFTLILSVAIASVE